MKKLLTTAALSLLLIGFAGGAYGQPDFEETKRAAEQGNVYSQYVLGVLYDNGEGVLEDNAEAVRWYRLAAEQGNAAAQSNLGFMYANGEGVPLNNAEAVRCFAVIQGQVALQKDALPF